MKLENLFSDPFLVLAYHKVLDVENFEKHILYLKNRNYSFTNSFSSNSFLKQKELPKKTVIITFDDGDPSFYFNAFPVLKKHKIPTILFIITELIDSVTPFWWDEIEYYLGREKGNKKVWEVKKWSNSKREMFLNDLRTNSNKPELQKEQLTTEQLREMQQAGIVIANHSHTHPMFDQCSQEELETEMRESKKILRNLGFTFEMFAYPNGNYSLETEQVLKQFGITAGFLFDHRINKSRKFNPLRISRLVVNDSTPMWKFRLILSGWHSRILPLTRAIGKFREK